jgi:hypothetical protein
VNKTANIFGNGLFARQLVFEKLGQGISRAILVSTFSELCSCLTTISIEYRPSLKFTRKFFVKFSASPNYIVNPKIDFFGILLLSEILLISKHAKYFAEKKRPWNQALRSIQTGRDLATRREFSMTFNFNIFQCFSNIRNHLSNFSYLICISCKNFIR